MKENQTLRRQFLKISGAALAVIPAIVVSGRADSATNANLRASLFIPGASAKDLGGCKIMPGDTEISPQGYCVAWVKKG